MEVYNQNPADYEYGSYSESGKKQVKDRSVAMSVIKVYLYLALGLLLTGISAVGYPYLIYAIFGNNIDIYLNSMIVMLILYLPLSFATSFAGLSKHSAIITVLYVLYALVFGALFSTFSLYLDAPTLLYGFFVTALVFAGMGVLGVMTKGKMARWLYFLSAMIFGVMIISLFNILLFGNSWLYWLASLLILFFFLIMTGVDTNRVMTNARNHAFDSNNTLVVFSAYCLYTDFVIILMYVLRFLMIFGGRRS